MTTETSLEMVMAPPQARPWVRSAEGQACVQRRAEAAARAILEAGSREELTAGLAVGTTADGSSVRRISHGVLRLSEQVAALAVAGSLGASVEVGAWEAVRRRYVPALLSVEEVTVAAHEHTPRWHADLWTADTAVNLALALRYGGADLGEAEAVEAFVRQRCLKPIVADWLDDSTRLHSLDSMGHNWWSVIVGGAGVVAALLGDEALARRVAGSLRAWFRYPGNEAARKRPNFGIEGDFVEGFAYCEYGLTHPFAFAHWYDGFRVVPEGLTMRQARGLADWLKHGFVKEAEGYRPRRLGDVPHGYRPHGEVWHSLSRLVEDPELLALAYAIKPEPQRPMELLMWEPRPRVTETARKRARKSLKTFATSGMAFLERGDQHVAIRAGECWNHNHLDAGTFIFQQEGVTWIDDAGTCSYNRAEYMDYYVTPLAHNVAYAPALAPPMRRTHYEGAAATGRYLSRGHVNGLTTLCVDSGVVSGGSLLRSYRWFLQLRDEALLVWDDLGAHHEERFELRLHTACAVEKRGSHYLLRQGQHACGVYPFSDLPHELSLEPAAMGQLASSRGETPQDLEGTALVWQTAAAIRCKFGTIVGTRVREAEWSTVPDEAGWEARVETAGGTWRIWFNALADGRFMHKNCIGCWGDLQSDAYALVRHESNGRTMLAAVEGSFVRRGDRVLAGHPARRALMRVLLR